MHLIRTKNQMCPDEKLDFSGATADSSSFVQLPVPTAPTDMGDSKSEPPSHGCCLIR